MGRQGAVRGCEVIWDLATADKMQELIEGATGQPCPCKRGQRCMVIPDDLQLEQSIAARQPLAC